MFHGEMSAGTAQGLQVLRGRIEKAKIPPSQLDETLNVATWNIREFGRRERMDASLHFIAEIIGQFDLVAVTELRDDLRELARVLEYLGPYWRAVFSDYNTDGAGNNERIAYVYDKRTAVFTGLAAEADPYREKVEGRYVSEIDWWRSPYMASFRAGNFDFVLITAHIRWGERVSDRKPPLAELAKWVDARSKEATATDKDIIVVGDFNIPSVGSSTYKALTSLGLKMPKALVGAHGTNLAKKMRYDQILHLERTEGRFTDNAGVLDFYDGDFSPLYPGVSKTKDQFTYELSDHLPLWVQVDTWVEDARLEQLLQRGDT